MKRFGLATIFIACVMPGALARSQSSAGKEPRAKSRPPASGPVTTSSRHQVAAPASASVRNLTNELVSDYCSGCHHEGKKSGGVSFETFDAGKVTADPDLGERMIKKLRTGLMPPPTAKRPEAEEARTMVEYLEQRLDRAAALKPRPGFRSFQRLNRPEYARSVKDLLDIDVDVTAFLPPDTMAHGFDNVADAQMFSPTLMEGYLRAASKVSSLAVGDRNASPTESTYKLDRTAPQTSHTEGAPFGTRGGVSVVHNFPADGDYTFRMMLHSIPTGQLFGSTVKGEELEVSVDGGRVALLSINPRMSEADPNGMNLQTSRVHVTAGPHRVSAAFIQKFEAPVDDLLAPIDYTLADTQIGSGYGVTALPHLRDFAITGPLKVTGISDTPGRRRVFSCRPTEPDEETLCARDIISNLASIAYRGNVDARDESGLMTLYGKGRKDDFEAGVKMALQAILASPKFLFRIEETPAVIKIGETYRISDLELASRLSFFLWGSGPDAELLKAAKAQTLKDPGTLETQVRRMLLDPRAEALSTRFASQWLRLQDLDKIRPDALLYPFYDANLAEDLRRETQLLFHSIVQEDRSVLDFLAADYTFVNERVARHYGIPNVTGPQFRRVDLKGTKRRGVLGHGSILALTSVADRTSPVQRGKWILEVILGSSPPPPPPNTPALEDTKGVSNAGKTLTTRERLEEHRRDPACRSCHRVIDPLGLALENFDVDGRWRIKDSGALVDAMGSLYDGTPLEGPDDLRKALLNRKEAVLRSFTEYLMTYALGRRIDPRDGPTIRSVVREASLSGYRFSSFALAVSKSAPFTRGQAQPAPAQRAVDMASSAENLRKGTAGTTVSR